MPNSVAVPNIKQKSVPTAIAFSLSVVGAVSDALLKAVATRILLDSDHFGGYLEKHKHWSGLLPLLHGIAYFAAALSVLQSLALETGNINLVVHKAYALDRDKLRGMLTLKHFRSASFYISAAVLYVNLWGCAYVAMSTVEDFNDFHIPKPGLLTIQAIFTLVNAPLSFATDGGFFAQLAKRMVDFLSNCCIWLKDKCHNSPQIEEDSKSYQGMNVYKPRSASMNVPQDKPQDENEFLLPVTPTVQPFWRRMFKEVTDMSGCFDDEVLYVPKKSRFAKVAWYLMQYGIGSFNALIDAGYVATVFHDLVPKNSSLFYHIALYHMMSVAFLQSLGLDGAVSAGSVARLCEGSTMEKKTYSMLTICMTLLVGVFCGVQAFAVGFVGMEEILNLGLFSACSPQTILILSYLAAVTKLAMNTGVELSVFSDKFGLMFPAKGGMPSQAVSQIPNYGTSVNDENSSVTAETSFSAYIPLT